MKMKKRYAWRVWLTAAVGAAVLGGCGIDGQKPVGLTDSIEAASIGEGSGSGELIRSTRTFAAEDFDSLQVNATAMEIYVRRSDNGRAEIELLTDRSIDSRITMDASVISRRLELNVTEEDTRHWLIDRAQKGQRKLVIALPDKVYANVRIGNEFGLVDAADLRAESTRIELAAGTIRLRGGAGELDLKTEAGNIAVEGVKLERDLSARASAGNITIELQEPPEAADIDLRSEIGRVEAELPGLALRTNKTNRIAGTIGTGGPRLAADTEAGRILVR
jgi:hypothetical protein